MATSESGGLRIDDRVTTEAKRLWPWFHSLVSLRLHDGPCAAQILEEVAVRVSERLEQDERVGANLRGYLTRSFLRRLNRDVQRDQKLQFRGLARDLESILKPISPQWVQELEARLVVDSISACLDADAQRMLNFRRLEYPWKFIAKQFGLSEKQARQAFYYRLREAAWALFGQPDRNEDL